jgi:hypothetical protein
LCCDGCPRAFHIGKHHLFISYINLLMAS